MSHSALIKPAYYIHPGLPLKQMLARGGLCVLWTPGIVLSSNSPRGFGTVSLTLQKRINRV